MHMYTPTHIHICIYIKLYTYIVYIYIYICIYAYTYVYVDMYISMNMSAPSFSWSLRAQEVAAPLFSSPGYAEPAPQLGIESLCKTSLNTQNPNVTLALLPLVDGIWWRILGGSRKRVA